MSQGRDAQTVEGYRAPIFLSLVQAAVTVGGAPRELIFSLAAFCFGVWFIWKTWGVIPIYLGGHALLAYLTYRDPWWVQVWQEKVRISLVLFKKRWEAHR